MKRGDRGQLAWTGWGLGVVGLWLAHKLPLFDAGAVWPAGIGALLSGPRVATSPLAGLVSALALATLWTLSGRRVVRWLRPPGIAPVEELALAAGIGIGTGATLIAWLGVLHLLSPGPMLGVALAWSAVTLVPGGASQEVDAPGWPRRDAFDLPLGIALVAGAVTAAVALLHALVPPWQPDALYYQLTLPRLYLEHGGFVTLAQEPVVSAYPGLGQMLFAMALAAGRDDLAALASWLHAPVFALAAYALVHRLASDATKDAARNAARAGLTAVAVVASLPQLWVVGSAPLVDVITAAQLALGLLAAVCAWDGAADRAADGALRWAALGALCLGFAVANKYLALPPAGLLALALVAACGRGGARNAGLATLVVAGLALAPCAPWMIKNARDWGSPLFPLHCPQSLPERVRTVVREHQASFAGVGRTSPVLLLPLDVTFNSDPNDIERYQGEVGPLLLALLPLPLLAGRPRRRVLVLALYALAVAGVWAAATRQVRVLLPLVAPLLSVVLSGPRPRALVWCVALGALGCSAWTVSFLRPGNDLAYLTGRETREAFYRSMHATSSLYEAFSKLAREPGGRVVFFWEYRGYLCPRPFLPEHAYRLLDFPHETPALLARLRELGVSHVMVNRSVANEGHAVGPERAFAPALEALLKADGVRPVPLAPSPGPVIELWRLPRPLEEP